MPLPGLTPDEARALIISVGTHHGKRLLSPIEVAKLLRKAVASGANRDQCASSLGLKGQDMVTRFLRLLDLSPFVQHSTDWRQTGPTISFTSAWKLASLEKEEQEEACREIMASQLTTKEAEQVVQLRQRSQRRLSDCVAEVVRMRPSVVRVHVVIGAITDSRVKEWLTGKTQAQRDDLFRVVLSDTFASARKCSGRLGSDRFTIVTNDQGYEIVNPGHAGSFETTVTQALSRKVDS